MQRLLWLIIVDRFVKRRSNYFYGRRKFLELPLRGIIDSNQVTAGFRITLNVSMLAIYVDLLHTRHSRGFDFD